MIDTNSTGEVSNIGVGCFNCNGLANNQKRELVLEWLSGKDDNIIFLQETHSTLETEQLWRSKWHGEILFSHGSSNSTGVAILIKKEAHHELKIIKQANMYQGRALVVQILKLTALARF